MSKSVLSKWPTDYISTLQQHVVPHLEGAGLDAQSYTKGVAAENFHRGVIGYAYAVSARRRLERYVKSEGVPFTCTSSGPWRYVFSNGRHESFFVYAIYSDTNLLHLRGHSGRSARKAASAAKGTGAAGCQLPLDLPGFNFTHQAGVPLLCLVFGEEFTVENVILGRLVDVTEGNKSTPSYRLIDPISLTNGMPVFGENSDMEVHDEELLDDVDVHFPAAQESGTEDE